MARVSDAYQGSYLSVEKWPESPTIGTITAAGLDDDKFAKAKNARIVWIQLGKDQPKIRINPTNSKELVKVFGDDLDKWVGRDVTYHRAQGVVMGERRWVSVVAAVEVAKSVKGGKGKK